MIGSYDADRCLGTLACSPFHVRFGKFSLLRPYEKKVLWWRVGNIGNSWLTQRTGRVHRQWSQAGLSDEAGGRRRGILRL